MTGTEIVLDILDVIMEDKTVNFNQLKAAFGINQSTLSRHLKLMCEKDFLTKNAQGQYCLGYKLERFEGSGRSDQFYYMIDEMTRSLSEQNRVTTQYIDFAYGKMTCRSKYAVEDGVTMQALGSVRINYCYNPWGVIFISGNIGHWSRYVNPEYSFPGSDRMTPLSEEEIRLKINVLSKRGYVDDEGQIIMNLRRIAVPIRGQDGIVKGAMACGFIDGSLEEAAVETIIDSMKKAVTEMSG